MVANISVASYKIALRVLILASGTGAHHGCLGNKTSRGQIMNSNQRSQGNNQSDNGGNEKSVSSSRGGTVEKDLTQQGNQSQQQAEPGQKQSNDLAGGYPRSPAAGGKLAADENMDDDTGLSNRANRQSAEQDQANRQSEQSNVGRRDDGTPD